MHRLAPALAAVVICACGGIQPPSSGTGSTTMLRSNSCDYLSTADFESTLGLSLTGYRSGPTCAYRDETGDTCDVIVTTDASRYSASKAGAAAYGTVEGLEVGDRGFFSAKLQTPGVWVFDFGFTKSGEFGGGLCGGRFGAANPRPQAAKLAGLIASKL